MPAILKQLFLILISFQICQNIWAHHSPTCREALVEIAQPAQMHISEFQEKIKHFFRYQKKGPYVARAFLVELTNGEQVLSFGEYLGVLHEVMLKDLETKSGDNTIKKTQWVGELEFDIDAHGEFFLIHGNQTSGMWFDAVSGKKAIPLKVPLEEIGNSGAALMRFIERAGLMHSHDFEVEPFAAEKKHLLLDLKIPENDSLLHSINNIMNVVGLRISLMVELGDPVDEESVMSASTNLEKVVLPVIHQLENMYMARAPEPFKDALFFTDEYLSAMLRARKALEAREPIHPEDIHLLLDRDSSAKVTSFLSAIEKSIYSIELATTIPDSDDSQGQVTRIVPQIFHFRLDPVIP